jgi:hypothetical protein
MAIAEIAHRRLKNQRLSSTNIRKPADVVKWLCAVQAQDFYGVKWALGLRLQSATDAGIEKAFNDGDIVRTHVMRPTWHFVAPSDLRWLLKLTAPRVNAISSHYYRKFELDNRFFKRTNKVFMNALRGGKHLTRAELRTELQRAGVDPGDSIRLGLVLLRAELEGIICSGPRRESHFTYALLEERVPEVKTATHDEALAELTGRYFASRGPATLQDFVWWSGLTMTDAKSGVQMVQGQLAKEVIDGKDYWASSSVPRSVPAGPVAYLLPAYDEYIIAYKDRSVALDATARKIASERNPVFNSVIVIDGRIVGGWKRTLKEDTVIVTLNPRRPLRKAEMLAVTEAARRYGTFLARPVVMDWNNG